MNMRVFLAILLLVPLFHLRAGAVIEASGELPADARDEHGDTIGGIGSGLVYDAKEDLFYTVSDRGPGDGTLPYRPRLVILKVTQQGEKLTVQIVKSLFLRDAEGREMTGLIPDDATATTPQMKDGRTCIDPEALALAPDGTIYITDEYGPFLYQFAADGKMIRRIEMPEDFRPKTADGRLDFTDKAELISGREVNRGPEGMCLLPDGKSVALIFQSGLVQDGARKSPTTRLITLDLSTGTPTGMYLYPFTTDSSGESEPVKLKHLSVNDLASLGGTRFLVLERDKFGRTGSRDHKPAGYKAVWKIDLSQGTNLLGPLAGVPKPLPKQFVYNLVTLVPDPGQLAAKWESIAPLPPLRGREVTLMMAADNDFLTPVIHHDGTEIRLPQTEDSVPTPFYKIRASLPENP
jgi:hypothetical protein